MKKRLLTFLLIFSMLFSSLQADAEEKKPASDKGTATAIQAPNNLYAKSACLMDGENNRVLYEKDGYKKMPMASTTKIMTCIVTLENADLNDTVTISENAAKQPDVQLNAKTGEEYNLKDLLYALMLESYNDVAVAIAEHVGGSVEGFAKMMNDKAKELGAMDTHFVTPNGLDAEEHYTTAADLAKIAGYAIKNKDFITITNAPSWQFKEQKGQSSHMAGNKNKLLYLLDGAIGVKTGFTGKAGYCFVGAAKREDRTFISVVLASGWPPNKNYKWRDTKILMDYAFNNYKRKQIFDHEKKFSPIPVIKGQTKNVTVYLEGDISLLMREDEQVKIVYDIPDTLPAPVAQEQTVGTARYYIGDDLYKELPILTVNGCKKIDYSYCFIRILKQFMIRF